MIAVMIAGATAMFFSLLGSRFLISFFRDRGKGQPILGKEDHGPEHHQKKSGTPTMGGLAIVSAAMIGWVVAHLRTDGFNLAYGTSSSPNQTVPLEASSPLTLLLAEKSMSAFDADSPKKATSLRQSSSPQSP